MTRRRENGVAVLLLGIIIEETTKVGFRDSHSSELVGMMMFVF